MTLPEEFKHYATVHFNCIVCGSDDLEEFASQDYMTAKRCLHCGMISTNPYLTDDGVDAFYNSYFQHRTSAELAELFELRKHQYVKDREFVESVVSSGKILDVGCSGGYFLSEFTQDSWERFGTDLTLDALTNASKKFGITTFQGGIHHVPDDLRFDVITMRGVLEHIRDLRPAIDKAHRLLKPGGIFVVLAAPVGNSFAFEIYRGSWRLFTPLEHVHFFSLPTLDKFLSPSFSRIKVDFPYYDTPYCDVPKDFEIMSEAVVEKSRGKPISVESRSFPGSMINAVYRRA